VERAEQAFVDGLRPAQIALGVRVAAEPELDPAELLQRVGGALGRARTGSRGISDFHDSTDQHGS